MKKFKRVLALSLFFMFLLSNFAFAGFLETNSIQNNYNSHGIDMFLVEEN